MAYVRKRRVYRKKGVVPKRKPVYRKRTSVAAVVKRLIHKEAEKKHDDIILASTDYNMGQCAGNADAYYAGDVTPFQTTGANANQHIGNEIAITSMNMQYQIRQMSAATTPAKVKFFLFRLKGTNTEPAAALVGNLFLDNQFIGGGNSVVDYNSVMNQDYMSNYQLLRQWTAYLKPDQFSGQQMPCIKRIGCKFKKPLKLQWFTNTASSISHGRIILVALPDSGNASTTTASTLTNAPVLAANTGQLLNFSIRWYYTDI